MINRRLIRIKAFQKLYVDFQNSEPAVRSIVGSTNKSILGMENNFFGVLAFCPKLATYLFQEHNPSEYKFNPSSEDLKSFQLFTENSFVKAMEADKDFSNYLKQPSIDWNSDKDILFIIYKKIKEESFYKIAISKPLDDTVMYEFVKALYKYLILESVEFEEFMEENNIYWYDEKIPVLKACERLFKSFEENGRPEIPGFASTLDEDILMAEQLIENYYEHQAETRAVIDKYTPGWESERITKIDYILMTMALTEFKYLNMIPVKVTLNEYIEIAKMYSTPKSSKFLNGTLDKILQDWTDNGEINKTGRGLIG